jgi:hypothetical protein
MSILVFSPVANLMHHPLRYFSLLPGYRLSRENEVQPYFGKGIFVWTSFAREKHAHLLQVSASCAACQNVSFHQKKRRVLMKIWLKKSNPKAQGKKAPFKSGNISEGFFNFVPPSTFLLNA